MNYKHMLPFLLCMALGCTEDASGPVLQKVVPNETPPLALEPVPMREQASTAEILALKELRDQQEAEKRAEIEAAQPEETPVPDLRTLSPQERAESGRIFQDRRLTPLPEPMPDRVRKEDPLINRTRDRDRPNPLPQSTNQPKLAKAAQRRFGGGRVFEARPRTIPLEDAASEILPPGRFFKARLIGTVSASVFSPVVFAAIYDATGREIGTAVGQAQLHRTAKDRVLLSFQRIHLDDGRILNGNLTGFDLDLSQGVRGRKIRRSFQRFALAVAETFLAALSLEVETGGDSFGNVFKFNLANQLFDQARDEIHDLELDRQVQLGRDTLFWVSSTREVSIRSQPVAPAWDVLATPAQDAFRKTLDSQDYARDRRATLENAYRQLQDKIRDLPGTPEEVDP